MMRVRADQLVALRDAVAFDVMRQVAAELDDAYPELDGHDEFVRDVVRFASELGFEGSDEVRRLAHLMRIDPSRLEGKPLSRCVIGVLYDTNRKGWQRLDFIDKYLLPRLLGDAQNPQEDA